jgi:hypothetical protein
MQIYWIRLLTISSKYVIIFQELVGYTLRQLKNISKYLVQIILNKLYELKKLYISGYEVNMQRLQLGVRQLPLAQRAVSCRIPNCSS